MLFICNCKTVHILPTSYCCGFFSHKFEFCYFFFLMKCFSSHFIIAFQLAHEPFIVVILAHSNPQSGDGFAFFFFSTRSSFIHLFLYCSDANRVKRWVNSWFNTQLFYLGVFFFDRIIINVYISIALVHWTCQCLYHWTNRTFFWLTDVW